MPGYASLISLQQSVRWRRRGDLFRLVGALCLASMAGCGSGSSNTPVPQQATPQNYFAPFVSGATYTEVNPDGSLGAVSLGGVALSYTLDDAGSQFSQTSYQLHPPTQQGPQVLTAGTLSIGQRGLRNLAITVTYAANVDTKSYQAFPTPNAPVAGSYALELDQQAGGLVQLLGQPVVPVVAATQCPTLKQTQTYQFLTLPGPLAQQTAGVTPAYAWDPNTDTAYGSVDISGSGSTLTFNNIQQFTLPKLPALMPGQPTQAASFPTTGFCAPTFAGVVTSVPYPVIIGQPGPSRQFSPAQATIGIGPSGLLVENNGQSSGSSGTTPQPTYNNLLGAGTGAVGLPKPGSALDTGALVGAQYLGFIYSAGAYVQGTPPAWSSHLASFGFSSVPSGCSSVAPPTDTLIYGGDLDPSSSAGGNCDFAIDLGPQDSNGLYAHTKLWVGDAYPGNSTKASYSFPAVTIAGVLNGKKALFVLGLDATQPWSIYLLQSS